MRPLIIKDKYVGKDKIDSYKDFVLEDKYLIKEVEEGFKVEGKIYLRGKISYLDDEEEIYKEIDVNILIPFEKLESRNMIKLVLDHAEYSKNDNVLLIKIKVKVIGDEEMKENFNIISERKMEYPPEEKVSVSKDFIKEMEDIFKFNEDVEVVSSLKEEKNEDIDIFDVRIENEDVLPLIDDEVKKEKEETKIEVKEQEEIIPKEEILKSEYVTTFFFYRVKEKENLEDILNRFNMSYDEFTKLNKKTSVKENDLIQLKIK